MISKIITVFWIFLLLSAIPCCCLYKSSPWECDSEEVESKPCIEALIRYGFEPELVSDDSGRITLPRHIFNMEWEKYNIDSTAFDFENGKSCLSVTNCDKNKIFLMSREDSDNSDNFFYKSWQISMTKSVHHPPLSIYSDNSFYNSWMITIDERFASEDLIKSFKGVSARYKNIGDLWKIYYSFRAEYCTIEFAYCDSIDKLQTQESFIMIARELFSNIKDCMEER